MVADYVNKQPTSSPSAATQIDELPVGIALRKDDTELQDAVQEAIDAMYDDGTIEEIFAKWKVDDFMLEAPASGDEADVPRVLARIAAFDAGCVPRVPRARRGRCGRRCGRRSTSR